jgi:hypothetical protein
VLGHPAVYRQKTSYIAQVIFAVICALFLAGHVILGGIPIGHLFAISAVALSCALWSTRWTALIIIPFIYYVGYGCGQAGYRQLYSAWADSAILTLGLCAAIGQMIRREHNLWKSPVDAIAWLYLFFAAVTVFRAFPSFGMSYVRMAELSRAFGGLVVYSIVVQLTHTPHWANRAAWMAALSGGLTGIIAWIQVAMADPFVPEVIPGSAVGHAEPLAGHMTGMTAFVISLTFFDRGRRRWLWLFFSLVGLATLGVTISRTAWGTTAVILPIILCFAAFRCHWGFGLLAIACVLAGFIALYRVPAIQPENPKSLRGHIIRDLQTLHPNRVFTSFCRARGWNYEECRKTISEHHILGHMMNRRVGASLYVLLAADNGLASACLFLVVMLWAVGFGLLRGSILAPSLLNSSVIGCSFAILAYLIQGMGTQPGPGWEFVHLIWFFAALNQVSLAVGNPHDMHSMYERHFGCLVLLLSLAATMIALTVLIYIRTIHVS